MFPKNMCSHVTGEICSNRDRTSFPQFTVKKVKRKKEEKKDTAIIVTEQMLHGKDCLQIHCKLITSFLKYIEKFSLMSEMKYL